jgi:plastocyanin
MKTERQMYPHPNNFGDDSEATITTAGGSAFLWAILALLAMIAATSAFAETHTVNVGPESQHVFQPSTVTIQPGDTVEWIWKSSGHTVTAGNTNGDHGIPNGMFGTGSVRNTNFVYSFTFPDPGNFTYYCGPHYEMGMVGVVNVVVPGSGAKLLNIATRLRVQGGDSVLIGGMIATGSVNKKVIIRALGPTLTDFGLAGAIPDPTLELFQGNVLVASNDDWKNSAQQAEIQNSGVAPGKDPESAIIAFLQANQNYTAIVRGKDGEPGVALVDAYDLDTGADARLANISTRGFVDVGDNVLIAGLTVGPSGAGSLNVLVRALGPTLGDFGVQGFLANPTLDLVDANGTVKRSNDDWQSSQGAQIQAANLAPKYDPEAALLDSLTPGAYTAVVRGNSQTTGVGLVEVYRLD